MGCCSGSGVSRDFTLDFTRKDPFFSGKAGYCGGTDLLISKGLSLKTADGGEVQYYCEFAEPPNEDNNLAGNSDDLYQKLMQVPTGSEHIILQIDFGVQGDSDGNWKTSNLHEFTIEIAPGPVRCLQQGYIGAYTCYWWNNTVAIDENDGSQVWCDREKGEYSDDKILPQMRERFGKGQAIDNGDYEWLAGQISAFCALGGSLGNPVEYGDIMEDGRRIPEQGSFAGWQALPFLPGGSVPSQDNYPMVGVFEWVIDSDHECQIDLQDDGFFSQQLFETKFYDGVNEAGKEAFRAKNKVFIPARWEGCCESSDDEDE